MEQFSVDMFWLAIVATAAATVLYWGYAFGARLAVRRLATDGAPRHSHGNHLGAAAYLRWAGSDGRGLAGHRPAGRGAGGPLAGH